MTLGTMRTMNYLLPTLCLGIALSGCSISKLELPKVHKVPIQQGNVITQEMVDRIKPGMTKSQVVYVMGEPVLQDPFNADKWTYIYSIEVPGYFNQKSKMVLFFDEDMLVRFSGDMLPTDQKEALTEETESNSEAVDETVGGTIDGTTGEIAANNKAEA